MLTIKKPFQFCVPANGLIVEESETIFKGSWGRVNMALKGWSNFSRLTISEFIYQNKVTFFSARTSLNFSHFPLQVDHAYVPLISCQRDTKNVFYYQCDEGVIRELDLVIHLLFAKNEYTHVIFPSVILVSIFMSQVYLTFSLFLKI